VIDPPNNDIEIGGSRSWWRLAERRGAPGGVCSSVNTKSRSAWRQRKSHQAIVAVTMKTKALSAWRYMSLARWFGSGSAWRYVFPARRFCCNRLVLYFLLCAWSTRLLGYLKGRLADVPWVVAQNVSLELWLGIGVKHVVFLELWLGIISLELWLGMADEHEELLSYGSGWRVLLVWVCWLWPVRMGPYRLSSSIIDWWVW